VSVVVLGYNGLDYLDACLSSVLDQDMRRDEYEVIFADNASLDGSAEYVREHLPEVRVIQFDRNHGFAAGNNLAVPHTSGEWIVFLNQDTVASRSWLRELVDGVSASPDIAAGHANIIHPWYPDFTGVGTRAESPRAYTPDLTRWGYCRYRNLGAVRDPADVLILSGAALAVRRSVIDELGYVFDPDFWAYGEDWDLGLRIRALGYRCVVVPRSTVYHLYTPKTKLRFANFQATVRNLRNRYLAFYKVMDWREFVAMAALLTIGGPLNAFEFGLKLHQRLAFAVALVPATALALAAAVWNLRRFAEKRREVRSRQSERRAWCLRAVWSEPLRTPAR
jgi:GT2 family glycosyltransferase